MHSLTPSSFQVVPAQRTDLDQIMEIERLCFSSPWARPVIEEEFDREFARLMLVRLNEGEETEKVLAFINYWIVHDEIHILNVATHPQWRRQGLAQLMLNHIRETAQQQQIRVVTLEVRRSNQNAIALYNKNGFRTVGIRHRYYDDKEDAQVMVLDFTPETL